MKTQTTRQDMQRISSLLGDLIVSPAQLPVSFTYAGKAYTALPEGGCAKSRFLDANIVETVYTVKLDENLQLKAEIETYRDYPAVEWTLYFENTGKETSSILENLNAADLVFPGSAPRLLSNNGDPCSFEGYQNTFTDMTPGVSFAQSPRGGRSCDGAFPYQRILFDDHGFSVSIGWSGQWHSCWEGVVGGAHFTAGQEVVHTVIRPGEVFRSPRMTIVAFEGELERGINVWRRWYNAHVLPRAYGRPFPNMVQASNNGGGDEWTAATEEQQVSAIEKQIEGKAGAELWWIDAGWYPCTVDGQGYWPKTGTWLADPPRFPNGLKPVGDACKKAGLELLVWFEPERVREGTWLEQEHPEWMLCRHTDEELSDYAKGNRLLDLTQPECLKWLCEHISGMINEAGIRVYRQDFNFQPLPYWRENETEDRQGMVENLYIQGYLAYWDYLLLHTPNLMIDACASGGRRNDLETMRRSVPLHQTDFGYGHHPIKQKYSQALYTWITYFRGFNASWDNAEGEYIMPGRGVDTSSRVSPFGEYDIFCKFAPFMSSSSYSGLANNPEAYKLQEEMVALFKRVRHHFTHSDFYALTEQHYSREKWTAWQFNSPETRTGIVQFFRNNAAPEESLTVRFRALCPETTYIFENGRTGEKMEISGEKLLSEGFTESLGKRQASLWIYTAKTE